MYIFSALLIYIIFGFFLFIFQRRIVFNVTGIPQESAHYGLKNIEIIKLQNSNDIFTAYHNAYHRTDGKSTLLVEYGDYY